MMNAADAMVLSSDIEGLPLVLLQAAASGLPMVSTDVGGNSEVVIDGENGWLVPPQSPERLSAAMKRLMSLPGEERNAMGREGGAARVQTIRNRAAWWIGGSDFIRKSCDRGES